jgi:hypothetical protein
MAVDAWACVQANVQASSEAAGALISQHMLERCAWDEMYRLELFCRRCA